MIAVSQLRSIHAQEDIAARPLMECLTGTLRRAYDLDGGIEPACVLVTDDGQAFRLNTFEGSEKMDWAELTKRSLRDLVRFEAKLVRVCFARREDSVFGPSLWGVRVEEV